MLQVDRLERLPFCAEGVEATAQDAGREAMLTSSQMVRLSAEMLAYLEEEARRRGVDISTGYKEEIAARAELEKITPRNSDLLAMADRLPAPQAWYDE